eukprot:14119181-Alexandrium_andersonii.AAC.1
MGNSCLIAVGIGVIEAMCQRPWDASFRVAIDAPWQVAFDYGMVLEADTCSRARCKAWHDLVFPSRVAPSCVGVS